MSQWRKKHCKNQKEIDGCGNNTHYNVAVKVFDSGQRSEFSRHQQYFRKLFRFVHKLFFSFGIALNNSIRLRKREREK